MTHRDFFDILIQEAKAFKAEGYMEALIRNQHMHSYRTAALDNDLADAIVTQFINRIAANRGVDLGLYANDLAFPLERTS